MASLFSMQCHLRKDCVQYISDSFWDYSKKISLDTCDNVMKQLKLHSLWCVAILEVCNFFSLRKDSISLNIFLLFGFRCRVGSRTCSPEQFVKYVLPSGVCYTFRGEIRREFAKFIPTHTLAYVTHHEGHIWNCLYLLTRVK